METVVDRVIDIFHHHKRFSSIQKLCILAIVLGGVSLLTGLWTWLITYIISISSTVLICQYLITTDANFTLIEDLLILLKSHENDSWYTYLKEFVRGEKSSENTVQDQSDGQRKVENSSWEDEIHLLATLISQDFIRPWYLTVSNRHELLEEKEEVIFKAFRLLCLKFTKINIHELCRELLLCYKEHLRNFQQAKSVYNTRPRRKSIPSLNSPSAKKVSSVEEAYEMKFSYHSAVWEMENEITYLKSIINLLLSEFLVKQLQDSRTPQVLLVEILTYNVAKPAFDLLSNPDFLHECIVHILSDEALIEVPPEVSTSRSSDLVLFKDVREESEEEDEFKDPQPSFSSSTSIFEESSQKTELTGQQETRESLHYPLSTVEAQVALDEESDVNTNQSIPISLLGPAFCRDTEVSQEISDNGDGRDNPQEGHKFYLGSFDDISTSGDNSTRIFLNLRIVDTETASENRGANQYTLYTIQYDASYLEEGRTEVRTNRVKRRFREFINLQNRLEDNPTYKRNLKDVKGLTKWLSLPFGNMDKNNIEKRKKTLENFIKALLEKDHICNSPEMKEFLAYDGNAHIAFVRKAPDSVQPLTKMVRTFSSVFDKIGDKVGEISINVTDLLPSLPRRSQVRDPQSLEEDEDKILLEFGTIKGDVLVLENQLSSHVSTFCDGEVDSSDEKGKSEPQKSEGLLNEIHNAGLAEVVFDIVVQALQGRNCWVCRERVISLAKHMLGTAVSRWLKWQISDLTTPQRCAFYLHLFRESIWPNGKYDSSNREVKSERQRSATKEQAQRVLAEFFPDVLVQLLEKEDYDCGIEEIIDSIQYEKLNKHFIYTFLDLVLEKMFSDIQHEAVQKESQ
ncbi:sorting nexin-19-like [Saccostrea echinata]|uniref:sorting nexin-19-like n=1 Tax=Saccostrea echinata TaxID=191078 RepID=UPI002A80B2E3|nr:sorting nexin-19-like [Saccostrea echinata]